jgi:hypothetical protein
MVDVLSHCTPVCLQYLTKAEYLVSSWSVTSSPGRTSYLYSWISIWHQDRSAWVRLALSKGPNRIGVSLPSPNDWNRSSFRNVVFSNNLEFLKMNSVHRRSDSTAWTVGLLPHTAQAIFPKWCSSYPKLGAVIFTSPLSLWSVICTCCHLMANMKVTIIV